MVWTSFSCFIEILKIGNIKKHPFNFLVHTFFRLQSDGDICRSQWEVFNSCAVCASSELALTEMNNRGDIDGHYISAGSVFPAAVSELRERFHRCLRDFFFNLSVHLSTTLSQALKPIQSKLSAGLILFNGVCRFSKIWSKLNTTPAAPSSAPQPKSC